MSFSILYSDVFLSEKTEVTYERGSLLDAIKTKYPLISEDVFVSSKTENGIFEIPYKMLPYIRPKNGEYIAFVKPKDRNTARIALSIGLIVAGQGWAAGTFAAGSTALGFAGAAVIVGSVYLASALIPYKTQSALKSDSKSDSAESSTSSISGSGNPINKGGTVPYLIGTHKFSPPKAMQPVTEYVNKTDAYLTEVFCLGYGPLIIDYNDIKIGDTSVSEYSNVELQVKDDYINSSPITLVSGTVDSAAVSATFRDTNDTAVRTTSTNCERIDVEIGYPSLTAYNSSGNKILTSCVYRIEYRETGTSNWIGFNGSAIQSSVVAYANPSIISIKDGLRQVYRKVTVNNSYFNFPNGIQPHITVGNYFNIYGSTYNNGSFFAYSISGNNVFVGEYTITGDYMQSVTQYGRVLTNESTAISYDPSAAPINSTDTDATSVATYRTHTLTNIKKGQYDVRITRITPAPASDSNTRNEFQWTQLKSTQLTDDNGNAVSAFSDKYCYIGLRIKATDQLNGAISDLTLKAKSVCYSYNEAEQSLTGELASGNPAWEYLKVLNGSAAKQVVDLEDVDIDAFIEWAELCDEQVIGSDGLYDPRFRINTVIDTSTTEEEVLKKIASIGRASRRWVDFKESVIIDKPDIQPSIFLNPANIMSFKWEKSFARKADAYRLSFFNQENDYESDELIVKIDDSVPYLDLDYIEDLDASGITDPDQVYRYGKFAHAQLKLRPETYTATLGVNNLVFLRGDVISLTHDRVQGVSCFGQVLSRNGLTLTVDNPSNISNADLPLYATFGNPDSYEQTVATYQITNITNNLIIFSSLPSFNLVDSYYSIGNTVSSLTRLYIVKGITSADDLTATVQLVDYASPEIYDAANSIANYVSGTADLTISQVASPLPPKIVDVITDESALEINPDASLRVRALIELSTDYINTGRPEPKTVEIYYKASNSNGEFFKVVKDIEENLYVDNVGQSLNYDFKVRYVSIFGAASSFAYKNNVKIIGKTSLPPDVVNIDYVNGIITWDYPNPPLDFRGFKIRYSTGAKAVWANSLPLNDGVISANSYDVSDFTASTNSFFVKAIDSSRNLSQTAAKVVVELGDYDESNIVTEINKYNDGWPDDITNGFVSISDGFLYSDTGLFYSSDNVLFFNINNAENFYGPNAVEMTYEFYFTPQTQDFGASMFVEIGSNVDSAYMEWIPAFSTPFYSEDTEIFYPPVSSLFYAQNSDVYSKFNGFANSLIVSEYKIKVVVPANKVVGSRLEYVRLIVDVPDIDEIIDNFTVTGGQARLPLNEIYRTIDNIQLTLQDDSGNAVSAKIVDKSESLGPLIRVFDSSGLLTESIVDARVRGY